MRLHDGMGGQKELSGVLNMPAAGQIKAVAIVIFQQACKVALRALQGGLQSMGQRDLMRCSPCALLPEREEIQIQQLSQLFWVIGVIGRQRKAQRFFPVVDVERCQQECGAGDEFNMAAQVQEWLDHGALDAAVVIQERP